MATIQDVAHYANVGAATVSRVLSGNGYVKEETRKKVESAIKELNYTPNQMARNLYFHKSGIVAVIVPEVSHPFFAEFVSEAEAELCEKGYETMICNTYYEQNFELQYLDMLKQQRVDGIIFGGHTLDVELFENINRPIVALDRELGDKIPCIAADHQQGGKLAALELIKAGCHRVIQFGGRNEITTPSNERHTIFANLMEQNGIYCYSQPMRYNVWNNEYYRSIVREALDACPDADGVFGTDMIIIACRQALLEKGKRIPEDVKMVSYDGTSVMELLSPTITYVKQPISGLAKNAVDLVVDRIEGKNDTEKAENISLPVTLVKGNSTLR